MTEASASLTNAEAFSLLASPVRVAIVEALGDHYDRDPATRWTPLRSDSPAYLSYSELKERVAVRDNGRLNYHLNELRGEFVEQCDSEYRLTCIGKLAYRFLIAGTFDERPSEWTVEVDERCDFCGGALEAEYDSHQHFTVSCLSCDVVYAGVHSPARGMRSRSTEEAIAAADRRMRWEMSLMRNGLCPWCSAPVESHLDHVSDGDGGDVDGDIVTVTHTCQSCGSLRFYQLCADLLSHPEVVAFYADHGEDIREHRTWEIEFLHPRYTSVESTDPLRVEITVPLDGDRLRLTVDEDLQVIEATRFAADTPDGDGHTSAADSGGQIDRPEEPHASPN